MFVCIQQLGKNVQTSSLQATNAASCMASFQRHYEPQTIRLST